MNKKCLSVLFGSLVILAASPSALLVAEPLPVTKQLGTVFSAIPAEERALPVTKVGPYSKVSPQLFDLEAGGK